MPYTYNPATGGYDYDPNGAIPDTGGNNYSDTGMNPQNPFNFNYGNGSSWAGYGDNQNNNPQWPGGTYDNTPASGNNRPYNPDLPGMGSGNFDKFAGNPNLYSPSGPLDRNVGADWRNALEPVANSPWNTPTGGIYTDEFGNQQPNTIISRIPAGGMSGNWFNDNNIGSLGNGGMFGFNGSGSGKRDPNLNYASGGGDVYSPDILGTGNRSGGFDNSKLGVGSTTTPIYSINGKTYGGVPSPDPYTSFNPTSDPRQAQYALAELVNSNPGGDYQIVQTPNGYQVVQATGGTGGTPITATGLSPIQDGDSRLGGGTGGLSPDISSYNPTVDHNALLQTARDAATANEAAQANRPAQTGSGAVFDQASQYRNLFGGFNPGWQQGFNELYNKQFTSGSDEFNRVFGSTQGAGYGNNFNWNIQPGLVTDNLYDETFRTQAESVARANPQITFEPVMVDGKWYLASRAQDQSAQKSLLAPVLPPSGPANANTGAKTSSSASSGSNSGSKFVNYGSKGTSSTSKSPVNMGKAVNGIANAATGIAQYLKDGNPMGHQQTVADVGGYKEGDTNGDGWVYHNGGWVNTRVSGAVNQPYTPVSGTGSGYVPMQPNLPASAPYVPPSNDGRRLNDPMPTGPALGIGGGAKVGPVIPPGNPATSGYFPPSYPGSYDGELSPDGGYMWGANGRMWYRR